MSKMLLLVLAAMLPLSAGAEAYKWKDANGQVHYSETPPLGQQVETVRGAPPPSSNPNQDSLNQSLQGAQKAEAKQKDAANKAAGDQARKDADCANVRDQLAHLDNATAHRMATKNADGTVSKWSVGEFDQHRAELQGYLRDKCS